MPLPLVTPGLHTVVRTTGRTAQISSLVEGRHNGAVGTPDEDTGYLVDGDSVPMLACWSVCVRIPSCGDAVCDVFV